MEAIRVRQLSGKVLLEVKLEQCGRVGDLRARVAEALDVHAVAVRLLAGGGGTGADELQDDRFLEEYAASVPSSGGSVAEVTAVLDSEAQENEEKELKFLFLWMTGMKNVEDLNCRPELRVFNRELRGLPAGVGKLTKVRLLDASHNVLYRLPNEIGNMLMLEDLCLDNNSLTALPGTIGMLKNLKNFAMQDNLLKELPESFGELTGLESLRLDRNKLAALPNTFCNLTSLKLCGLEGNELTELPDNFGELAGLKGLWLGKNKLTALPPTFGKLQELEYLSAVDNCVAELPANFCQLSSLLALYLRGNRLAALPDAIGDMQKLERLSIKGNAIAKLPVGLGALSKLEFLHVDWCLFKSMPWNSRRVATRRHKKVRDMKNSD